MFIFVLKMTPILSEFSPITRKIKIMKFFKLFFPFYPTHSVPFIKFPTTSERGGVCISLIMTGPNRYTNAKFLKTISEIVPDNCMIQMISLSFLYHKNCDNETELYPKFKILVNETFTQQMSNSLFSFFFYLLSNFSKNWTPNVIS